VTDWYERPTEEILKSKPPYDMYTGWYCVEIRPPPRGAILSPGKTGGR